MPKIRFFSTQINFVSKLLQSKPTADRLSSIYSHNFNQQLFEGTLSASAFGKYLHDDYIYLHHYALILISLANRLISKHADLAQHLINLSQVIVSGEQEMQLRYSDYFTNTPDSKPGEAISAYIDFLNEHAEAAELPIALCSILPCFWIYAELGSIALPPEQLASNPYKEWIETYSSKEFIEATQTLAAIINQLAIQVDLEIQEKMTLAFNQAVNFELQFFDEVEPNQVLVLV